MNVQTVVTKENQAVGVNPNNILTVLQLFFEICLNHEAQTISVVVIGPSISISDDGHGMTKDAFLQEFPSFELKALLDQLGCSKVQIISSTDEESWSTGLITADQLLQPELDDIDNPSAGTTYALQFDFIIDNWKRHVALARGMLPLTVKYNGESIPTIDLGNNSWFSLETTFQSGKFVLNPDLAGGNLVTPDGFCVHVWDSTPRSLFIPSSSGEQEFQQRDGPKSLYILALRAATKSLRSNLRDEGWDGPTDVIDLDEMSELIRLVSHRIPTGQISPCALVDFGYLLGYAPIFSPIWKLRSAGLELEDVSLERFDRRPQVVEGMGTKSCAILANSGVAVSPDSQSHPALPRVNLYLLSMREGPDIYRLLEHHFVDTSGPFVVPCREILLGEQKIQWAIVTPDDKKILIDGNEIGMPPWSFLAITLDKFQIVKTLLYEDTNLLKTFLWVLSRQSPDDYDWCFFKAHASKPALSIDRARVILLEFLTKALDVQDTTMENFCKRSRDIEQMLNPSFLAGRLEIAVSDQDLAETLNALDGEVVRLKKIRRTLWSVHSDEV